MVKLASILEVVDEMLTSGWWLSPLPHSAACPGGPRKGKAHRRSADNPGVAQELFTLLEREDVKSMGVLWRVGRQGMDIFGKEALQW
jgi:hypothetical protein